MDTHVCIIGLTSEPPEPKMLADASCVGAGVGVGVGAVVGGGVM